MEILPCNWYISSGEETVTSVAVFLCVGKMIEKKIKKQLYFESRNRKVYVLSIDWKKAIFEISKVEFISEDEKNEIKYISTNNHINKFLN